MLRVSSYRRFFEEEQWTGAGGISRRCAEQYRPSARALDGPWGEPDFEEARTQNKEAVSRFVQERGVIAALNDRLAVLVEMVRCLEEENKSLECEILELEGKQSGEGTVDHRGLPDYSLEAVVEKLRREKGDTLCDVTELKRELEHLQVQHAEVEAQRSLIHNAREDVALDVDAVTAECLALRDQLNIFEQQLAAIQEAHEMTVENLVEPGENIVALALEFPRPDVAPAIQEIKEYYQELAESLQYELKLAAPYPMLAEREAAAVSARALHAGKVADVTEAMDTGELRRQVETLRRELAQLEQCGGQLEGEIEQRGEAHLQEIEELECYAADLKAVQQDLETEMREHCGCYDELLNEKMALDIEICAYRGLVQQEEERLCYL
ncbi:vimentin [Paramormyrops kingsleyae]|uniref:Vimentin-related 2 n=1 Tax=Paramormyrops kingsleyae TaxID=1676925 RepID=A0A3B3ST78_9TELE|nr:vimentin-like [Paramormyrops kingsleyae]